VACNLSFVVKYEGVVKVTGSNVHCKIGSVLKTVLDKDVETSPQTGSDMPYGHLITATVMTLGVCQGHSSIASFSILTSASCGLSAMAELHLFLSSLCCCPNGQFLQSVPLQ